MSTRTSSWAIAWSVITLIAVLWILVVLLSHYSAADVRAICVSHSGVQQVVDNTWSGGDGKATVVCRDGWVGTIS